MVVRYVWLYRTSSPATKKVTSDKEDRLVADIDRLTSNGLEMARDHDLRERNSDALRVCQNIDEP